MVGLFVSMMFDPCSWSFGFRLAELLGALPLDHVQSRLLEIDTTRWDLVRRLGCPKCMAMTIARQPSCQRKVRAILGEQPG